MELISKYNGAVFFVDILGIGALTNNQMILTEDDYNPWLYENGLEHSNQFIAAAILDKFRQILISLEEQFANVTISQLSDCAFVWSKKITDVIFFASVFMNTAIQKGLLCRGGLAYGEILETNHNHHLGRFIVGKAVTDAVKCEGMAKGARVLVPKDFYWTLRELEIGFSELIDPMFNTFTNPLDFTEYSEFQWYLCPDLKSMVQVLEKSKLWCIEHLPKTNLHLPKSDLKLQIE
jgi:hypothetical protein